MREYYKAYDDRYQQIHSLNLSWFDTQPSPIVWDVVKRYGIDTDAQLLEVGCGEGRDARFLLDRGFHLLATDVSPAAIEYCRRNHCEYADAFQTLDCLKETLNRKFDFLYAVAVLHMLVPDDDRAGFFRFIREHLKEQGIALLCTMGDGTLERQSDISTAFDLQARVHEQTGTEVKIAGTSCRVVSFDTLRRELAENALTVLEMGTTAVEPDFPMLMYTVVKRAT